MVSITVEKNESIDKALKRLKRRMEKSGILKEFRNRQSYQKKSVVRRNEIGKAIYRQKMQSKD